MVIIIPTREYVKPFSTKIKNIQANITELITNRIFKNSTFSFINHELKIAHEGAMI